VASGVPEAAEQVARYAQVWFEEYLRGEHAPARTSSAHP
jgi:hypothetical protein